MSINFSFFLGPNHNRRRIQWNHGNNAYRRDIRVTDRMDHCPLGGFDPSRRWVHLFRQFEVRLQDSHPELQLHVCTESRGTDRRQLAYNRVWP